MAPLPDALVREVGALIAADSELGGGDWAGLSVVVIAQGGSTSISGYAYPESGAAKAVSPRGFTLHKRFRTLRDEMTKASGKDWATCLVQIRRPQMSVTIQFDYDDAMRWKVTPANLATMVERLRPR